MSLAYFEELMIERAGNGSTGIYIVNISCSVGGSTRAVLFLKVITLKSYRPGIGGMSTSLTLIVLSHCPSPSPEGYLGYNWAIGVFIKKT